MSPKQMYSVDVRWTYSDGTGDVQTLRILARSEDEARGKADRTSAEALRRPHVLPNAPHRTAYFVGRVTTEVKA